jgi:glycosyltransferase involved in cell wall biosynthesis
MALPLSRGVCWLAGRRADAIVAVSHVVHAALCANRAIPRQRVQVIYNATRFATREQIPTLATRAHARQALGLSATGHWVGFCGGLDPKKGALDVAAAVAHTNTCLGPTNVFICGRADPSRTLSSADRLAERYQLQGRVTYLGETDRMELALTAADAVVVATRRQLSEALPSTLLEAMACGTPVVGYATGGIAEVIGADGGAGRLARADDPEDLGRVLSEVLRDRDEASRMAMRALDRVRTTFDAEPIVDAYEQLFAQVRKER